ncbi:MAG: EAL domain-containing protein [Lachnospiraceae bacterium]|nr:EAL domain-containing protein [Lachnospiraceae bacterium]
MDNISVKENKRKLLIVEDDLVGQNILARSFKDEYEVYKADNGIEALKTLRTVGDIDLVLLDWIMPEVDGEQVLKAMRSDEKLASVPVVVVTGLKDEETQLKALDYGVEDFVAKPYNVKIIAKRVENIMRRLKVAQMKADKDPLLNILQVEYIDSLTNIYNNTGFNEYTGEMLKKNPDKRFTVLRWNVDRFKAYNSLKGNKAGNTFLWRVGEILQNWKAVGEFTYGHVGADHFVCCFESEKNSVDDVVTWICNEVNEISNDYSFSLRFGVCYKEPGSENASVAELCDKAYLAIQSVKNHYSKRVGYYDKKMMEELIHEQQISGDMHLALKNGEFVVYFQPQHNYAINSVHGAEALVRWKKPDGQLVSPDQFIPIFERNKFIVEVDKFVWEKVFEYQKKWIDESLNVVPISVNISRTDIYESDVCKTFSELLKKYEIDPHYIRVEITESMYGDEAGSDDESRIISTVKKLQELGFIVEMDDFGSKYSSLNNLKDTPVDVLKLDMKFLGKVLENGENIDDTRAGHILNSVVRMAKWIKLPVIAEGVESKPQADFLLSVGCNYMQGYFFARPMPVEDFVKYLNEHKTETLNSDESDESYYYDIGTKFLDLTSDDSKIFEMFVGGAAILEVNGEKIELTRANTMFFRQLKVTHEEFFARNRNFAEYLTEKTRKALLEAFELSKAKYEQENAEIEIVADWLENESLWFECRVRYLASNGQQSLFYCDFSLINDRKKLEVTEKNLANIVGNVPCGVMLLKAYPNKKRTVMFASKQTFSIMGCPEKYSDDLKPEEEVLNKLLHKNIRHRIEDNLFDSGKPLYNKGSYQDYIEIKINGHYKWIRMVASIVEDECPLVYVTLLEMKDMHSRIEKAFKVADVVAWQYIFSEDRIESIFDPLRLLPYNVKNFSKWIKDKENGYIAEESVNNLLTALEKLKKWDSNSDAIECDVCFINEGKKIWRTISFEVIEENGVPVSAIVISNNRYLTKAKALIESEMKMMRESESIYVWSYFCDSKRFRPRNKGAIKLGITNEEDRIFLNETLTKGALLELNEKVIKAVDYAYVQNGEILLDVNNVAGISCLRTRYSANYESDGTISSITFVAEDCSYSRAEQMEIEEAAERLTWGVDKGTPENALIDLTANVIEVGEGKYLKAGENYDKACKKMLEKVADKENVESLKEMLSREALISNYSGNTNGVSIEFEMSGDRIGESFNAHLELLFYVDNSDDDKAGNLKAYLWVTNGKENN